MHRLLQNTGFRIHLIVYGAVNALLMVIDLAGSPDKLWFLWPLLGWGLGLLGHAYLVTRTARWNPSPPSRTAAGEVETDLGALQIQTMARELWDAHGTKSIAEAAQKAQAFEAAGNEKQGKTWRRIEEALKQLSGPHVS